VAIYDRRHDQMVVHGGDGGYEETWALSLSGHPSWRLIAPSFGFCGTTGRLGESAIYDPVRDRMVMFGGECREPDDYQYYLNDVSALPLSGGSSWTPISPSGSPPCGREGHSAIYDPVGDRMVVFGGYWDTDYCEGMRDDVWALSLAEPATWTQLSPSGTPPAARVGQAAVYDPVRRRMIVLGGYPLGLGFASDLIDVWALTLAGNPTWTQLSPSGTPPGAREAHTAVYDPTGDRVLVFGGFFAGSEVWALALSDPPTWTRLSPSGTPPGERSLHSAVYDPVRRQMFVFGGNDGSGSDVWVLSLRGDLAWSHLFPSGGLGTLPPGREEHTAIVDPIRDQMVVFGGTSSNAVWALSLGESPTWSQLAVAGTAPVARLGHTAIYDPAGQRMVMFGGGAWDPPYSLDGDLWTLSLAGTPTWTRLSVTGPAPPARAGHVAVYDPLRRRMLVFGGGEPAPPWSLYNDVWSLSLTGIPAWTQLLPTGPQPTGQAGSAVYDPVRDRMLVYEADWNNAERNWESAVWALALSGTPNWTRLSPAGAPPLPRWRISEAYDPVRDRIVVFSGESTDYRGPGISPYYYDVWALELSDSLSWVPLAFSSGVPSGRAGHTLVYDPGRDQIIVFGGDDYYTPPRNDVRALVWGARSKRHGRPGEPPSLASPTTAAAGARLEWNLDPPQPNPTGGATVIEFAVAQPADLTLSVFDVAGRRVATLAKGRHEPGRYQASWSGRAEVGPLPPGLYLVRLATPAGTFTRALAMLR
jgi:hypothetical protein